MKKHLTDVLVQIYVAAEQQWIQFLQQAKG